MNADLLATVKESVYVLYKFSEYSKITKRFLRNMYEEIDCHGNPAKGTKKLLLIIEQWTSTPLPFWELYLYALLRKKGMDVTILYADGPFYDDSSNMVISVRDRYIMRTLPDGFVSLSSFINSDISDYSGWIDFAIKVNSIHHIKGELKKDDAQSYADQIRGQLEWRLSKWLSVDFTEYDGVFFPGGLYADTSFICRLCEKSDVKYYTVDAGIKDVILTSTNGVAAHLDDIRRSYDLFRADKRLFSSGWKQAALSLIEERREKKDTFSYQYISVDEDTNTYNNVGYLLMMNSVWDSAALGINTDAFSSFSDFIFDTIRWVLDYTKEHITIRQHPMDRSVFQRGTDDYYSIINKMFSKNERVHFIRAEDKVNSYKLIDNAKAVLVFSSTVALEAVILGKPVICVSNCYYSDMGFVFKANTRDEYNKYLCDVRDGKLVLKDDFFDKALLTYFLTQKCNWVETRFVPSHFHFKYYANAHSISEVETLGNVDILLQSIIENVPISYLYAKRLLGEE